MTTRTPVDGKRQLRLALMLSGLAAGLGACTHAAENFTSGIPDDYRLRHPIAIQEADRTITVFVGSGRGGLTSLQRSEVGAMAGAWQREGTGPVFVDVPVGSPNARAAADTFREIQAVFAASGMPPRSFVKRPYHPENPRLFAPIKLSYPRITASAGPCGLWPEDLGPSIKNRGYVDNKPYYNFGCAHQRNLAAMVENPTDLVQPQPETPAYTTRRTTSFSKYRAGNTTTTLYPEADKAKLSDTGK